MAISFATRIFTAPYVVIQTSPKESALYNPNTETFFETDAVGARMWFLLTGSESIERAYESLLAEFDADPQQLRQDLEEFVNRLLEHRLIEIPTDGPAPPPISGPRP